MIVADICGIIPKPVETARRIIQLDGALPSDGYDECIKTGSHLDYFPLLKTFSFEFL